MRGRHDALHFPAARAIAPAALAAVLCLSAMLGGCVSTEDIYGDVRRRRALSYRNWARRTPRDRSQGVVLRGELSLERALTVALANSKDLQNVLQEQARATGRMWQGYSAALPSINASASYQRLDEVAGGSVTFSGTTLRVGDKDSYAVGLTARQPLFQGGAITAAITSARIFDLRNRGIRIVDKKCLRHEHRAPMVEYVLTGWDSGQLEMRI